MSFQKRRNFGLLVALAVLVLMSGFGVFANSNSQSGTSSAALRPAGAVVNNASSSSAQAPVLAAKTYPNGITVIPEVKHDTSAPLRSIAPIAPGQGRSEGDNERENPIHGTRSPIVSRIIDPVLQSSAPLAMPTPILTFDGVNNRDGVYPPDTNGDVGPNHYVQWVNLSFQIFSKTGASMYGPAAGNTLWAGFGGPCQTTNDGDPVVLYDKMADRWLMSQFALPNYPNGPFYECIAISQTGDPVGAWYRYAFQTSASKMDDYPKLGVWPDGYYMSANLFSTSGNWAGVGAYAFDRAAMLAGNTATMQFKELPPSEWAAPLPSDLDGTTLPPAGAPNTFVEVVHHDWDPGNIPVTGLLLYKYHVDWANPANTTWTGPTTLATAPWNPYVCGPSFDRNCIAQLGTTVKLDAISDRPMYRAAYRNFGDHESIVLNHTVDVDGNQAGYAGVRWYEIRGINTTPVIYQQSTFSPDSTSRWMGSAAMDRDGNLAVGFSKSSSSMYASIFYAGRLASDPLNQLSQGEAQMFAGTGAQTGTGHRWGDYSMLKTDPTDDCTFWYTNEYIQTTGTASWRTRIGSFKFPGCGAGVSTPTPTSTATATPTQQPTNTATATPSGTPATATPTVTPCPMNFSDVHPSDYFYTPVQYLFCEGAISGYADGTFRPFNNTTRGQLSKIIVLAEGWPIDTTGGPHFTDVPSGSAFYGYVETAYNHGIISGYADNTFRPGNNVTRAQLSKIVVSAQGWTIDTAGGPHFVDVPPTDAFYGFIETAYNHGIISGYADNTFRPGANATRGQISKIVYGAVTQP